MKRVSVKGRGLDSIIPITPGAAEKPETTTAAGKKVKMLFSVPAELARKLDIVWFELRDKYRGKKNIEKSEIVSLALNTILKDYSEKKEEGIIYRYLDTKI